MPAKRKASAGKKGGAKEPEAGTRRSTRGASASTDSKSTAGSKRKASPSPTPAPKRAASAKKGRTASPSPVSETRTSRGRSTPAKEEPKPVPPKADKSASNRKGRVTRNVVQEVEKKTTETKSRSSSRGSKAPATPKNSTTAKSKAATPSPKVQTPKKRAETPKQKANSRGRSATPKQTKATPKKTEESPKRKPSPKQKPVPKKKQEPVAKKERTKSTLVKKTKSETPPKSSRSRRSRDAEPIEETKGNSEESIEDPAEKNVDEKPTEDSKEEIAEVGTRPEAVAKETEAVDEETTHENHQTAEKMEDEENENIKEDDEDEKEPEDKVDGIEKEDAGVEEDQTIEENKEEIKEKIEEKLEKEESAEVIEEMETDTKEEETEENKKDEEVKPDEVKECEENILETVNEADSKHIENDKVDENEQLEEEKSDEVTKITENIKETVNEVNSEPVENEKTEENVELSETEVSATMQQSKENSVEANEKVIEETSIDLVDEDSSNGVEVISAQSEDLSPKVIDLNEDSGEAMITQEEPAVINDLTNDDVGNGAGDQESNKKMPPVEEISDDDVEEIETVTNNVQGNGATDTNAVNDEVEVIEFVNQEDKYVENCSTKRKFDDVENQNVDDSSPHKKVRLSATEEEDIQENGSGTQEDMAKDYVVIEMSDVPASDSAEVQTSLPNPIFNRSFIPNPAFSGSSDNSKQFSLVSYNILADCHLFKNDYSFTESKYLQPEYRLKNVIEELRHLDSDIVCLQEVDPQFFSDQLLPSMKSFGYDGVHKKRNAEYYNEGEATFYKTSRFTLIETQASTFSQLLQKEIEGIEPATQEAVRKYTDLPDVVIVTKLQCKNSGREVTIGNVHINWGEMKMPDTQCVQIASAVKEIVSKATGDNFPHIICGDFNSPPMSPGYLVARDGYPSGDETINTLMRIEGLEMTDSKKASLVNSVWPAFQHTSSSLRSVYSEAQGYEPEISSYNRVMCDTVDYIFYSSVSLENVGVLQTAPKERVMETGGIPNRFFPSDHISIKAVLSFK